MNPETPSNLVLRQAREKRITDYYNKDDGRNMDAELDAYPYGDIRPNISEERAREIGSEVLRKAA